MTNKAAKKAKFHMQAVQRQNGIDKVVPLCKPWESLTTVNHIDKVDCDYCKYEFGKLKGT